MRIFKHRHFHRWAQAQNLSDSMLKNVIHEIGKGLFDVHLGGGLYKQRVARKGGGKRDGYRTLIAFKRDNRSIFMYGFSKNERDNVSQKEQDVYKYLAKFYLNATEIQVHTLINKGELIEVLS